MMTARIVVGTVALLAGLALPSCGGGSALATGVQLGAFLGALQQIRTQVSETMTGVDTIAQNRLRQVDISLEARIKQMDEAAKGNIQMAAAEQERMFENVFLALNELGHALEATPREAFLSLNATLANIATLADALPFVDLEPSIFVADPVVHDPDAANRQVSFYGYFPGTNDGEATVQLGGQTYPLNRFPGKLAFDIPADMLKEDKKFVEMTVQLKKKGWLSFFSAAPIYHHRIYIRARKPYDIVVASYQTHPDLWQKITAPKQFQRTANSTVQTNNGQETAPNLYVELGADTTTYDQQSALIVSEDTKLGTSRSTPCDSCCPGTSQSFTISGDSKTLSWNLHAPNCPSKASGCPGLFDTCGGGGSNANVGGGITFRVKKRGIPEEKELERRTFQMGREDVASQPFGTSWTQVKAVGTYLDGDYPVKVAGTVSTARTVETNSYFTVEADPKTGEIQVRTHKK